MAVSTYGEDEGVKRAQELARQQEASADAADEAARSELQNIRHSLKVSKPKAARSQPLLRQRKKRWLRRGGSAIVGVGFMGVMVAIALFSPSLLLVNVKEQLVNDLNDSTLAYYTYARKVLAQQVAGGSACTEKTIECKFRSMSNMLKERYEERGFTVQAARSSSSDRYTVTSLKTPSGAVATDPPSFQKMIDGGGVATDQIYDVVDPKNALFHDRKFAHRLYEKFRLHHNQSLSGGSQQDVEKSFDRNLWSDDDSLDGYGRGVYGLEYLSQTEGVWRDEIYNKITEKAKTHMALTCGMNTYATVMEAAMINAKATTLARFAKQYLATADAIKAGVQSGDQEVEFLANRLSASSSNVTATDGSSYRVPAMYETPQSQQQPYGRSYMNDTSLALTIVRAFGGVFGMPGTTYLQNASTSLRGAAAGRESCVRGLSRSQEAAEQAAQCLDPGVVSIARYIGPVGFAATQIPQFQQLVRGLCQASVSSVVEIARTLTKPEASVASAALLGPVLTQEHKRFSSQTHGIAAQDAIFSGTGIILGDVAQSIGMRPASKDSLRQYVAATSESYDHLQRVERLAAQQTPWDITNRHSFMGTIVQQMGGVGLLTQASSIGAGTTLLTSTFSHATLGLVAPAASALYSQPANTNLERLRTAAECTIPGDLQINPDFGCNVRYSLSADDLNKNVLDVVRYMSTTQSNAGTIPSDVGADTEVERRLQEEVNQGNGATFIDPVTGAPNKHTEYAKFLEYCTNRSLPWGYVGMKTEYQPEQYSPDEDMGPRGIRTYSHQNYGQSMQNPDVTPSSELPWAYYGAAWGSEDDYEWMTGKKCLEESPMLSHFRAYTIMCRALAGMSGTRECWHEDALPEFNSGFYPRNNILFIRE